MVIYSNNSKVQLLLLSFLFIETHPSHLSPGCAMASPAQWLSSFCTLFSVWVYIFFNRHNAVVLSWICATMQKLTNLKATRLWDGPYDIRLCLHRIRFCHPNLGNSRLRCPVKPNAQGSRLDATGPNGTQSLDFLGFFKEIMIHKARGFKDLGETKALSHLLCFF